MTTSVKEYLPLISKKRSLALWLVILFCLLLYLPTIRYDFVYDDEVLLPHHSWIRDVSHLPNILTSSVWDVSEERPIVYYRPMQLLLYQVVYLIFGLNPAAYHFLNLIFYILLCTAVFFLFLLFMPKARLMALAATLIFVAHPTHTESVAWVASLSELTFGFFYILALISYLLGQLANNKRHRIGWHVSGCVFFFMALLSKEMAVSLPLILIMAEIFLIPYMRETSLGQKSFQKKTRNFSALPFYLGILIVALSLRTYALGGFIPQEQYPEIQGLSIF